MSTSDDHGGDLEREDPAPTPAEAEAMELCAYLDGELGPVSTARIEAKIKADPAFAERVTALSRALEVTGELARQEADSLIAAIDVDGIANDVMRQIDREKLRAAPVVSLEAARTRKSKLVWFGVGTLAVAAAALVFVSTGTPTNVATKGDAPPRVPTSAIVATVTPSPRADAGIIAAVVMKPGDVEVDDLEVGEGAMVIVSDDTAGSPAVVWVQESREGTDP
jgi:anti-sigma factor RsiW